MLLKKKLKLLTINSNNKKLLIVLLNIMPSQLQAIASKNYAMIMLNLSNKKKTLV